MTVSVWSYLWVAAMVWLGCRLVDERRVANERFKRFEDEEADKRLVEKRTRMYTIEHVGCVVQGSTFEVPEGLRFGLLHCPYCGKGMRVRDRVDARADRGGGSDD